MKNLSLQISFIAILLIFNSCSSDNSSQNISSSLTDSKKESRGIAGKQGFGNKFSSADNSYIILKIDGTFEASFKDSDIVKGKWTKEEDGKKLKLNAVKSGDGKGKSYIKEFTILEHSDDVLKLIDSEGKKLEMSAE